MCTALDTSSIDGGEIRGNLFGLRVLDNARAFLRQPLVIGETTGGSHIDALNHSTVTLNDGVMITGLFNYFNLIADTLGIDLELGMPPREENLGEPTVEDE